MKTFMKTFMKTLPIQRNDTLYIGLGMSFGAWGGWFFAHHWLAVLVGLVCGCGAGTVVAIVARLVKRDTPPTSAVDAPTGRSKGLA